MLLCLEDLEGGDLEGEMWEVEVGTLKTGLNRLVRLLGYNWSNFVGESFAYTPFPPSKKELKAASLPFPIPISNRWLVCF